MRHLRTVHGQMEPQSTPIDAQRLEEALRSALKASYKKIVMEVILLILLSQSSCNLIYKSSSLFVII